MASNQGLHCIHVYWRLYTANKNFSIYFVTKINGHFSLDTIILGSIFKHVRMEMCYKEIPI